MTEKCDLVIVGSGVGGMALALGLAEKGLRITIIERHRTKAPMPRGEILQPNGLKILDRYGLLDTIRPSTSLNYLFHFFQTTGEHLCLIDYRRLPDPFNYSLIALPSTIQKVLLDRLCSKENVRIHWGMQFCELVRDGKRATGIRCIRQDGITQKGGEVEIRAPLVIGGDGAHSPVRRAAGLLHQIHFYRDGYLTLFIDLPSGYDQEARYYLGRRTILGVFPISHKRAYLFYLIPAGTFSEVQTRGLDTLKENITAIDPIIRDPLHEIVSWDQVTYMPCVRVRVKSWVADGVALLGDAAHAMNPHAAQGTNQALEDAVCLTETIESCFHRGDFSQKALLPYEKERRVPVEILQQLGDELVLFWNTGHPLLIRIRDRIFRRIDQNVRLQYKILATIAGLGAERYSLLDRFMAIGLLPDLHAHEIPQTPPRSPL